jgi:thiol-disulfide isomerase/thioredoxin
MRPATLLALAAALAACIGPPTQDGAAGGDDAPRAAARPEFVAAPREGALEAVVRAARAAALAEERLLLVYVGASWCEPCRHFHEAVEAGRFDRELANVRFLELDADADRDRIDASGYGGRLIPRFAVPAADGTATDRRIEGGTKSPAAADEILGRLAPLVEAERVALSRPSATPR